MREKYDVAVVGGGAAGLAAAVFAAREAGGTRSVVVLEKSARVGKRLLVTGNGTCNISNADAAGEYYHGKEPAFAQYALGQFPPRAACEFFSSIGLECVVRADARIYPLCEQAGAVLDCLRMECAALGVDEAVCMPVTGIVNTGGGFSLTATDGQALRASRIILCTGGMAAPGLGGSPEAYDLAVSLGHTRTPLFPSIVQIATDTAYVKSVKGIRADAGVTVLIGGREAAFCADEILFTDYGISGPGAMRVSRPVSDWQRRPKGNALIRLDLLPGMTEEQVIETVRRRIGMPGRCAGDILTGLLHKRLGQTVLRAGGYRLDMPACALGREDAGRIARIIKGWELPVTGVRGWKDAQVTAGGLSTDEFNPHTLQSRIVPGFYAAGEVLDIDGDCGGFNLQWAWSSAYTAATAAVRSL